MLSCILCVVWIAPLFLILCQLNPTTVTVILSYQCQSHFILSPDPFYPHLSHFIHTYPILSYPLILSYPIAYAHFCGTTRLEMSIYVLVSRVVVVVVVAKGNHARKRAYTAPFVVVAKSNQPREWARCSVLQEKGGRGVAKSYQAQYEYTRSFQGRRVVVEQRRGLVAGRRCRWQKNPPGRVSSNGRGWRQAGSVGDRKRQQGACQKGCFNVARRANPSSSRLSMEVGFPNTCVMVPQKFRPFRWRS